MESIVIVQPPDLRPETPAHTAKSEPADEAPQAPAARRGRLTAVVLVALLVPILPFLAIGELPGEAWLEAADQDALRFGATAATLLAADIWIPVPSSIVGTLTGARLGWSEGFAWVWSGLMVGNLLGYLSGRLLLGRLGAATREAPTLAGVLLSRPVPVLAEATTFVAGATRLRPLPFMLACGAGNGVYALTLVVSGAELLPGDLLGPGLAVPLLLPVAGWLLWKHRSSRR